MASNLAVAELPALRRFNFSRRELIPTERYQLWRIETGWVRILTWNEDGAVVTLGFWQGGDIVGQELSKIHPYQIECLTAVEATPLPSDYPHCQAALAAHLYQSQELLRIIHYRRVEFRLTELLNWLAQQFGRKVTQGYLIDLRLTHQDIADVIGTTRVTVTRLLNHFQQQGKISWCKQGWTWQSNRW
jgi:CRP-like cAMP-binding protein